MVEMAGGQADNVAETRNRQNQPLMNVHPALHWRDAGTTLPKCRQDGNEGVAKN